MKKILFIIPGGLGPGNGKKWNCEWSSEIECEVSMAMWRIITPGVLVLAALTDRKKYEVTVIDEEFQTIDFSVFYDIVAFYTVTSNAINAYKIASRFRSNGSYIVLGGVHASVLYKEAMEYADTVLIGEVEFTWPQFLLDFEKKNVQKIYQQSLGTVDIQKSPVPAYDLIPPNALKLIPVQTARGCPHGCHFCNLRNLYGSSYRAKSQTQMRNEFDIVTKLVTPTSIYFTDDNFFSNLEHAEDMIDLLKEYKITWFANTDISLSKHDKVIKKAFRSGCRGVLIGFESLNKNNLNNIDEKNFKMNNIDNYSDAILNIQQKGIGVVGSFIVGMENDNLETFVELEKFIKKTFLFGANITCFTPFPGTYFYNKLRNEKKIVSYDWNKYTIFQPVINLNYLTPEEFSDNYNKLLSSIYSYEHKMKKREYFTNIYRRLI